VTGTALLIHGLSSSPAGWWRVRAHLERTGWRTATAPLLGHDGRGPAPSYDLEAYAADALRPGPFDLVVGHSLGGSIATVLAARDPQWTRRLVLIDPVWYVPADELPAVAADQRGELDWTLDTLRAAKPHWDERDLEAKVAAVRAVDPGAVERTFEVAAWDLRADAAALRTPTLVLGGDPVVYTMLEPADAHAASEASGSIEYVIVPGAGHSPHRDEPEATLAAFDAWLEQTED
jgi:pimeloyl-ACP methyl ester carboxylesterase